MTSHKPAMSFLTLCVVPIISHFTQETNMSNTVQQSSELPFFASLGATTGELATASSANASLFKDGFLAGYHGSKKAHAVQRDAVRAALVKKYNL
jgi:hypothetical protein